MGFALQVGAFARRQASHQLLLLLLLIAAAAPACLLPAKNMLLWIMRCDQRLFAGTPFIFIFERKR